MIETHILDVGGAEFEVFTAGTQGPVICEAHPFTAVTVPDRWSLPLIEQGVCRIVKVNPRGFGKSSAADGSAATFVEQLVEDLEAVRTALGYDRWIFFGHSAGGLSGILYGTRYPHSLSGLILASVSPSLPLAIGDERSVLSPSNRTHVRNQEKIADRLSQEDWEVAGDTARWVRIDDQLWAYARNGEAEMYFPININPRQQAGILQTSQLDLRDMLPGIAVPTLVVCGQGDRLFPRHLCSILGEIPGSQTVVIDKTGHSPMDEDPATFRESVRGFLKKLDAEVTGGSDL